METGITILKSIKDNNEIIMNKDMTKQELKHVTKLVSKIPPPYSDPYITCPSCKRLTNDIVGHNKIYHKKVKRKYTKHKRKYTKHNTINKKAYDELIQLSSTRTMMIQHIPECIHCKEQASIHVSVDDAVNEYYCAKHGKWIKYLKNSDSK